jgi:hypothetical protein
MRMDSGITRSHSFADRPAKEKVWAESCSEKLIRIWWHRRLACADIGAGETPAPRTFLIYGWAEGP